MILSGKPKEGQVRFLLACRVLVRREGGSNPLKRALGSQLARMARPLERFGNESQGQ